MSLDVRNLKVYYRTLHGDVRAVDDVTFGIADGEIMGLAGESGCGKSSLGNSLVYLAGRMRYVSGDVDLDGVPLPIWDFEQMNHHRFKQISVIPQYAMSALNPTRKLGTLTAELLHSRGVPFHSVEAELVRRLELVGLFGGRPAPVSDRALGRNEAANGDGALDAARPVTADRG